MPKKEDKLMQAMRLVATVKSVAEALERDAKDLGVKFPLAHAAQLKDAVNKFLKNK